MFLSGCCSWEVNEAEPAALASTAAPSAAPLDAAPLARWRGAGGDVAERTHDGTHWALSATLFDGSGALGFGTNVNLDALHVVIPEPDTDLPVMMGGSWLARRKK